ncbi:MAG: 16S rRNA (uracil(1498)-N(3))-methyltransferase [Bacteroidales bacterium]|nr:16S rRNA (uracil(1498)-N(3))-methyltransferase [Bacteroidales bacterium]
MQLFYCADITGGYATLDAEESRHAVRVLRLREGDSLLLTSGRGDLYRCTIADADERACSLCVEESLPVDVEGPKLCLAVAPTKNPSRMEWLVEKAVEVGVSRIVLLNCSRSERTFMKTDRLQKIALSAMKQSLHTLLPAIEAPVPVAQWLAKEGADSTAQRLIAHCDEDSPRTPIASALHHGADTTVIIGPEGDFAPDEVEMALSLGFVPVSLGASRLRTETAALYAAVAFNLINDSQ